MIFLEREWAHVSLKVQIWTVTKEELSPFGT
jgi:hypothetical protein